MALEISSESLAEVIINNPFPQTFLMSESSFRSFLEKRAINIKSDDLEYFEAKGFLYPIVRIIRPTFLCKKISKTENGVTNDYLQPLEEGEAFDGEAVKKYEGIYDITHELSKYFDKGFVIFPNISNYKPWKDYKDGYEETIVPFYHPFQELLVNEILHLTTVTLHDSAFQSDGKNSFEYVHKYFQNNRKILFNLLAVRQRLIRLLLIVQDKYLPYLRKKFVGRSGVGFDQYYNDWFDWAGKL